MRTYRLVWAVSVVVLAAPCVVYDLVSGGGVRVAVLGPAMGLTGAFLGYSLADQRPDRWTWARRGLLWTGIGTVGADAFLATAGGFGALAGVGLLLTSPVVVGTVRTLFLAWSSRRTAGPPETLLTRDLRRRWDWTTGEVLRTGLPMARRLALVEERRALLDELQLRDPGHFDEWIATAVPDRGSARTRGGGERSWKRGW